MRTPSPAKIPLPRFLTLLLMLGCAVLFTVEAASSDTMNAKEQLSLGAYLHDQKEYTEATKWIRKAAEQGHPDAQFLLGTCYENGEGVPQNHTEAAKWFRKAADQGYALAQFNLGVSYEQGIGVSKNYTEAVRWYRKAARNGYTPAQKVLQKNGIDW